MFAGYLIISVVFASLAALGAWLLLSFSLAQAALIYVGVGVSTLVVLAGLSALSKGGRTLGARRSAYRKTAAARLGTAKKSY